MREYLNDLRELFKTLAFITTLVLLVLLAGVALALAWYYPREAFAAALAAPILFRCACVAVKVSGAKFRTDRGHGHWHGFALSYVALGGAAGWTVIDILRTGGSLALWAFLIASAGLVVFDPRRVRL